jgi:hypothetical protein
MCSSRDLLAGRARVAGLQLFFPVTLAEQGASQLPGEFPLADALWPNEQEGRREAVLLGRAAEEMFLMSMAPDFIPAH